MTQKGGGSTPTPRVRTFGRNEYRAHEIRKKMYRLNRVTKPLGTQQKSKRVEGREGSRPGLEVGKKKNQRKIGWGAQCGWVLRVRRGSTELGGRFREEVSVSGGGVWCGRKWRGGMQ